MTDNSELKELLDMVHNKADEILKNDPYHEYRKAVEWGEKRGMVKDLSEKEIQRRMDNLEWRKVNKIIIQNENRNNDTDSSSHSG
jgi:hypothetical protein